MHFTDVFIRRPVLATVVNLIILVLGLRSIGMMQVLQYPHMETGMIMVSTAYPGASADTVAGFITAPLEAAIAQSDGIDYMTSNSSQGRSSISVQLRLNYDSNKALTQIISAVESQTGSLPPQAQKPVVAMQAVRTINAMYISLQSKVLAQNKLTDYVKRVVQPKLQTAPGVQKIDLFGGQEFAVRVWLDPLRMAAHHLTSSMLRQALTNNNYISAAGSTKGAFIQINLSASTDLKTLDGFKKMVVSTEPSTGSIVRLEDVATVELGAADYTSASLFDGLPSVTLAVQAAPSANVLQVVKDVRKLFDEVKVQLPHGITGAVVYDATKFIESSIEEVAFTLVEALVIVGLVVFAFLGSPMAVLIPLLAIPLSLIGAFFVMWVLGYSINLLTLLSLVLAIGLVVDDAIIVVENVNRHLEEGLSPVDASVKAARELFSPIIAMTVVLAAVYLPIGFMGGLTGSMFTEFAFTLVGSVVISAIVALTLSPMMCSRILRPHDAIRSNWERKIVSFVDSSFERVSSAYKTLLHSSLDAIKYTLIISVLVLGGIYFFYSISQSELAPAEDQGIVISFMQSSPTATLQQRQHYAKLALNVMRSFPEVDHIFSIIYPGTMIEGAVLKPWGDRSRGAEKIVDLLNEKMPLISGVQAFALQPPPLPGSGGAGLQFVIESTDPPERVEIIADQFLDEVRKTNLFPYAVSDLKTDMPETIFEIDRDKAAQMGLDMSNVGADLGSLLSGVYVNFFNYSGQAYEVIPQIDDRFRANSDQILDYYLRTPAGKFLQLRTLAKPVTHSIPETINHFQQMNSATIQLMVMPGMAMGEALSALRKVASDILPPGYSVDYAGSLRQMVKESNAFATTFFFALLIIFLALAAQFESFRDPLIILVSVPTSMFGALFFISMRMATLNIYTEVGLVTLIGLISKHGILIVEFANKLQAQQGLSKREAVETAAFIRLRPVLMTTAAMVMGVIPLLFASGAGAASRFQIGLIIASGLLVGTCFTLFVLPAFYLLLARDHHGDAAPPPADSEGHQSHDRIEEDAR